MTHADKVKKYMKKHGVTLGEASKAVAAGGGDVKMCKCKKQKKVVNIKNVIKE